MKRRIMVVQILLTEGDESLNLNPKTLERMLIGNNSNSDWLNFYVEDYTVVDELVAEYK